MNNKPQRDEKLKAFKRNRIIITICAIVLGVLFVIWADRSLEVISQTIGIIILIGGVVIVVSNLVKRNTAFFSMASIVVGIVVAVIGIWIFLNPRVLSEVIPILIGVVVVASGLTDFWETVTLARQSYAKWWLSLILSIATIALGVLLIMRPFSAAKVLIRLCGLVMIFDGVSDLWMVSRISTVIENTIKDAEAIDADDIGGKAVEENDLKDNNLRG